MRDEAVKRLTTAEAIQALMEGRDRKHALLKIRKSHLASSWFDREKQVLCQCGWFAFVSARRERPEAVWRDHAASEESRPHRDDPPSPMLVRDVMANAEFVMAEAYSSEGAAMHAVSLLNRIEQDNRDSLGKRPPLMPPMPKERYLAPSLLDNSDE
jgi:hypothetical protein